MIRTARTILAVLAGLFGAAGVGLAATGAHVTGGQTVTTAAYFLLFHASALLGICALACGHRGVLAAGGLIAIGCLLFSGDLALRALAEVTLVRLAAPTGGVLMIAGWLVLAAALPFAFRRSSETRAET